MQKKLYGCTLCKLIFKRQKLKVFLAKAIDTLYGQYTDFFCTFLPFNSVSTKLCHVTCYIGDKKYPYIVGIGFTLNLHSVVANQSKAVKDQIKIR